MFTKEFDEITLADVQAVVDGGLPEGRQLEFKRDRYEKTDSGRRELVADVSAMANAVGGYLLIGVDEKNGVASEISGIVEPDPDSLILAVTQSILASTEPPLNDFRPRWLPMDGDRGVLILKIARSWSAPHRVTLGKSGHFYVRDESRKHQMSVDELRRAFLFASQVEERIRSFRMERLELIANDEGPLAVGQEDEAKLVLHVVPRAAFTDGLNLSFEEYGSHSWPWPLGGGSGANRMHSLDGQVSYSGSVNPQGNVRAFSTLFRNGIAEAVATVGVWEKDDQRWLSLYGVENDIIKGLRQVLSEYERRAIPMPYFVQLSLLGVRGVGAHLNDWGGGMSYPHRSDRVLLPELIVSAGNSRTLAETMLKPVFDLMWNAFGQPYSFSYDSSGDYIYR